MEEINAEMNAVIVYDRLGYKFEDEYEKKEVVSTGRRGYMQLVLYKRT